MAISTRLRYWLARLKALNQPLPWCSGLALALVAVVALEYQRNPDRVGQFQRGGNGPGADLSSAGLSFDQQAGIADIDTLSTLYSDLGVDPLLSPPGTSQPGIPGSGSLAPQPSQDLLSILQASGASSNAQPAAAATAAASPFDSYLERYRFLGSSGALNSGSIQPDPLALPPNFSLNPTSALPGGQPSAAAEGGRTPLQQAVQPSGAANFATTASPSQQNQGPGGTGEAPAATRGTAQAPAVSPTTLPGINQPLLQTTPQMSPPPGTTGYVPPAVLSLPAPGSPAVPPAAPLPSAAPVVPSLSSPSPPQPPGDPMGTGGGTALPPTSGTIYTPPEAVTPPPFSAPRPPGSHAGNGHIYTFSDPNGPAQ